jgi:hypothetical protein
MDNGEVQRLSIDTIRGLAMDMVEQAGAGHPGTAMALAPLSYTLFRRLRANPEARMRFSSGCQRRGAAARSPRRSWRQTGTVCLPSRSRSRRMSASPRCTLAATPLRAAES